MISKNSVIKLYPIEDQDFEDLFFAFTKGRGCDQGIAYFSETGVRDKRDKQVNVGTDEKREDFGQIF